MVVVVVPSGKKTCSGGSADSGRVVIIECQAILRQIIECRGLYQTAESRTYAKTRIIKDNPYNVWGARFCLGIVERISRLCLTYRPADMTGEFRGRTILGFRRGRCQKSAARSQTSKNHCFPVCHILIIGYNRCKLIKIIRIFVNFAEVMTIGSIDLGKRPVLLAPMEDVTDASFRILCRESGAAMVYTEFISSDGLIRDAVKAIAKMKTSDEEAPIGIQIYGNDLAAMVDAAKMADRAAEIAGGHGADLVDINFGCPVSKIAGRGAGSGMMKDPDKMVAITKAVVEAVGKPVTVKTRLGWDENSKIIVELAERLQDVGIQALTIHGRTRSQMYKGDADWTLIGEVKNNPRMKIPIIGNGDINSAVKAGEAFDRYGVDGIMVGRASFGHPWIFREIRHYLDTGEELPPMSVRDRVALAKRHLSLSLDLKGPVTGVYEMRRHLSCYFKGLPEFKDTRIRLVTEKDPEELVRILDYIADRWGEAELENPVGVYGL